MLMYAGIRDEDIPQARAGRPTMPIIRFQDKGVEIPPGELIGKTIKFLSQPIPGSFMVEIVEGKDAN